VIPLTYAANSFHLCQEKKPGKQKKKKKKKKKKEKTRLSKSLRIF